MTKENRAVKTDNEDSGKELEILRDFDAPRIKKFNRHDTTSDKKGLLGLFEIFIRKFKILSFLIVLIPIISLCILVIGVSLAPSVALLAAVHDYTGSSSLTIYSLAMGVALSFGYFLYGMSIILVAPAVNFILRLKLKPWRGNWRSVQTVPWYVHNALVYIVRYTFLDLITPSPLVNFFYIMMGMKIGKGVIINTTNISDPCLIEIGDYVTVGGSVHILAHYGQKGILILAPVIIKEGANIGLKSSIMGGAVIGANATVRPHSVVLPKTQIGDGEVF